MRSPRCGCPQASVTGRLPTLRVLVSGDRAAANAGEAAGGIGQVDSVPRAVRSMGRRRFLFRGSCSKGLHRPRPPPPPCPCRQRRRRSRHRRRQTPRRRREARARTQLCSPGSDDRVGAAPCSRGGPEHPLTTEQGSGNEQCTQDGNDLVEPLSEGFQGLLLRAARVGRKGPQLSVPSPGTASAGVVCQLVTMGLSTVTEPVDTLAGFGSDVPIAAMRNVNSTPPLVLVVLGLIPA